MSAYQDLMTALVTRRPDQSAAEDERVVLAALDKHAHELAKQIRKQTARGNMIREEFADPWEMGLLRASDVIDPWPDDESAGPVRPDEEPTT